MPDYISVDQAIADACETEAKERRRTQSPKTEHGKQGPTVSEARRLELAHPCLLEAAKHFKVSPNEIQRRTEAKIANWVKDHGSELRHRT